METHFLQPDSETFQQMIQDYIRASSSKMLVSQIVEEKVLIFEFEMYMKNFLEQKKTCICKIIDAQQKYQMLLQEREALRKRVMEQRLNFLGFLKKFYDDFFKGLSDIEQRHMKQHVETYGIVCKDTQDKFQHLFEMQQQELSKMKKKIFSLLM